MTALAVAVEIDEGKHFAADGLVTYPEDEVVAPLHGLDDVREGEEIGSDAFGVDFLFLSGVPPLPLPRVFWLQVLSFHRHSGSGRC